MAAFVLVHGGWHGSWCWGRVARRLTAAGHAVHAPTLSGHGDNAHRRAADVNLSTHITDVVNVLRDEDLSDVTLVGHSYGGNVITGAADAEAGRIARMIYLDGHVPEDGQSCWDLARRPPSRRRSSGPAGGNPTRSCNSATSTPPIPCGRSSKPPPATT
jgi:pimeloyl-ACP methyl ester carboxylesterase